MTIEKFIFHVNQLWLYNYQEKFNLFTYIVIMLMKNYEFWPYSDAIEKNYDLHQEDSRTPPYMAVSHVRDALLPPKERYGCFHNALKS